MVQNDRAGMWPILVAPPLGIATFLSYPFVFLKWPVTRDVPWVNVLMALITVVLIAVGIRRAFTRGIVWKSSSVLLAGLSLFGLWSFVMAVLMPQHLPASAGAPQVGQKIPDFTLPDTDNRPMSLSAFFDQPLAGGAPKAVLLIFEMGHGCHACSSELHDMQRHLNDLHAAGIRPVVLSNDPPALSKTLAEAAGYTFTFLSDPQRQVIKSFDLEDPQEDGAARPAEFLVDRQGIVRWRMLTDSIFVRARPAQILAAALTLN